jgi:transcriptional regulator with XRE-family HTH domain
MTWSSFEGRHADPQSARGFVLIGRTVRRRRHRLGLSQRQLQLLCGVHQSAISRLEIGRLGGLRWSRFARLVDAIGGLSESDPPPARYRRFLPQVGGRDPMRGYDPEDHG